MDNIGYLNQLLSVAITSGSGGGQADMDPSADPSDEGASALEAIAFPNPFEAPEIGTRINLVDGALSDGVELLLPNPITRHKLAYLRNQQKQQALNALQKWMAKDTSLPASLSVKLALKCEQLEQKQQLLRQQLKQDANQHFGWLGRLAGILMANNPASKVPTASNEPLTPELAAKLLWDLAQTPEEKTAIYTWVCQ